MQVDEAFPSKYLKATDFKGREVPVTMDRVEFEILNKEKKLILYFLGKAKGIVLNKTNAKMISKAYGGDTENWNGKPIILYEAQVEFAGDIVPAIRVKIPPQKRMSGGVSDQAMDDDVPF